MTDPTFVAASSANTGSATATSLTPALPTGWAAGDLAILTVHYGGNSLNTNGPGANGGPTGWSAIPDVSWPITAGTGSRMYGWYRVLQGGDTDPTISFDGNITGGATITAYRDVRPDSPLGQIGTATTSNGTTLNLATLTGVLARSIVATHCAIRVPTGTAIPGGIIPDGDYTEAIDHATNRNTATAQNLRMEAAWRQLLADGTLSGDSVTTTTGESGSWAGLTVELLAVTGAVTGGPTGSIPVTGIAVTGAIPPPPANLTAEYTDDGGIQICWENPGGQPWDDDFVYAEILRSDCVEASELGLNLPGEEGSYAWTSDKAALDITGDIDLRVDLTHRNWRPPVVSALIAKHNAPANQISYSLALTSSGNLELAWTTDGTLATRAIVVSTEPVPFGESRMAVRATLDVDNGSSQHVITFYTAPSMSDDWTQLGSAVTRGSTTSIYSSTAIVEVGTFSTGTQFPLTGVVHEARIYDGIAGTLVADPNFVDTLPDQTQLVDTAGNTWTIEGDAVLQEVPERRIAVISDGLSGCYTDYTVPVVDGNPGCHTSECEISYRVRYVGTISTTIEVPAEVPEGMIVGWPSTVGSIPSGWTRVTALDERFPRGSSADTSGATGGTSTHSHTTPGHTHSINSHTHSVGGSTGTSNSSTTSARFNGASQSQADQPHSHARPSATGSGGSATSGSISPSTGTDSHLPPYRDVIWVESDGTPTEFTVGMLAFSTEDVSGWADDAASTARFLRGAASGGNGGGTGGGSTHTHTVNSHTHTGTSHTHSLANTGLSNPLSTLEAGFGSSSPAWLPRHTHPMTVTSTSTGSTDSDSGGTTSAPNSEPPNRRLRVLANLSGGLQVRLIGLFRGSIASLPSTLTRCDGTDGTPDMRDLFARERGTSSVNTTAGSSTHTHTTASHSHSMPSHVHDTNVSVSNTGDFDAPSFGDLGDSPTTSHTHSSGNTASATPTTTSVTSGITNSANHLPPYEDVHFVRLDGVGTAPIDIPQVVESELSEVTISAPTVTSERFATDAGILEICPTSSYDLPRLQQRATPLVGGTPQVSTTTYGQQRRLNLTVTDADVPTLEALLAEEYIWYAPLTEDAAWYASGGWSVRPQIPGLKAVSVTLVRADPPEPEDPEDLL